MSESNLSRRSLLKLGLLTGGALVAMPLLEAAEQIKALIAQRKA